MSVFRTKKSVPSVVPCPVWSTPCPSIHVAGGLVEMGHVDFWAADAWVLECGWQVRVFWDLRCLLAHRK